MAGWHHRLDRHEFEWTPGVGDGQGGLACCNSWGRKESDTTEWLNWTELSIKGASLVAQLVKNPPAMQGTLLQFLGWEDHPGEGIGYPLQYSCDTLVTQLVKNRPLKWGDLDSIPGLGRYPGEGKGYPFQYSGLENSMDCIVHGVANSWTRLRDFHL